MQGKVIDALKEAKETMQDFKNRQKDMLNDYQEKITGLVKQKKGYNQEIEFLKGLLGGKKISEGDKAKINSETALTYLAILKGVEQKKKR